MKDWDSLYRQKGKIQKEVQKVVRQGIPILTSSKVRKVLDLGCGTGRHTFLLAEHGFEVHAMDISENGIAFIYKLVSENRIQNIRLTVVEMRRIPYRTDFFNAIVLSSVIDHAKTAEVIATFAEMDRVLKRSGFLIVKVISPKDYTSQTGTEIEPGTRIGIDDWDGDVPHHFFNKEELLEYLAGYEIIKFEEDSKMSERIGMLRWHYNLIARKAA